jgi:hypothetical protein
MNKIDIVKMKAKIYGATSVKPSQRKNKKYVVEYRDKLIHFGDNRYDDYLDHNDPIRRQSYLSRALHIRDKQGNLTANDPYSPNFWSIRVLW